MPPAKVAAVLNSPLWRPVFRHQLRLELGFAARWPTRPHQDGEEVFTLPCLPTCSGLSSLMVTALNYEHLCLHTPPHWLLVAPRRRAPPQVHLVSALCSGAGGWWVFRHGEGVTPDKWRGAQEASLGAAAERAGCVCFRLPRGPAQRPPVLLSLLSVNSGPRAVSSPKRVCLSSPFCPLPSVSALPFVPASPKRLAEGPGLSPASPPPSPLCRCGFSANSIIISLLVIPPPSTSRGVCCLSSSV